MFSRTDKSIETREIREEFFQRITRNHSRQGIVLLTFVAISQIIAIGLQIFGMFDLSWELLRWQFFLIGFSVTCAASLALLRKKNTPRATKILRIIVMGIHVITLSIGYYFTLSMVTLGEYTYSGFLITSFVVVFTYVAKPIYINITFAGLYIALTLEIALTFGFDVVSITEVVSAGLFMAILAASMNLSYKQALKSFIQERKLKQVNDVLKNMSEKDPLTNLYNRHKLLDELDLYIEQAKRYGEKFSLAVLDLDKFKSINDTYGHSAGDRVLIEFSSRVRKNLRANDILGRWGGEEFIVIVPKSDKKKAFELIERIRKKIERYHYKGIGRITFSGGVCEYSRELTPLALIDYADHALYRAKRLGRNQICICGHDDPMHENGSA